MIEKAVADARAQGIEIVRVPLFDWTDLGEDRSKPRACDATGAVLLSMGLGGTAVTYNGKTDVYGTGRRARSTRARTRRPRGASGPARANPWAGWDNGRVVQVPVKNDKGETVDWKDDEVSKMANKMAKRLCR